MLAGTASTSNNIDYGTNGPYGVGANGNGSSQSSDFIIDEIRIENTVRSQAYLLAMYKQGIGLADVTQIVDAQVSPTAAIQGTKITPNFGSQSIITTGALNAGSAVTTSLSTSLVDVSGKLAMENITSSVVSNAGQGVMYFDTTTNKFQVSQNGGAYSALATQTVQNGGNAWKSLVVYPFPGQTNTASTTFVTAATFEFDPTTITAANGTRTIKLRVIVETTGPQMTLQLFNVTSASVVSGSTITTSSTVPTLLVTGDISANLTNGAAVYQVQILMASGGSPSDRVTLDMATLRVDWS